jgi:hypothetical protein
LGHVKEDVLVMVMDHQGPMMENELVMVMEDE